MIQWFFSIRYAQNKIATILQTKLYIQFHVQLFVYFDLISRNFVPMVKIAPRQWFGPDQAKRISWTNADKAYYVHMCVTRPQCVHTTADRGLLHDKTYT